MQFRSLTFVPGFLLPMYVYHLQDPLTPAMLDLFLSQGFYRMHQTLFTTQIIYLSEGVRYDVYWARVVLSGFSPDRRHRELVRRNSRFTINMLDGMVLDEETEALYAKYEQQMNFDAPETVASFLLGQSEDNYFPSKTWQVRDGGLLIASGYFDMGVESAAGILNFYDPEYRKFSLGTWLYLESIRHAVEAGMNYFYPGYIAPGYAKFDYKLLAGKERIEIWDLSRNTWVSYTEAFRSFLPAI